MASPRSPLSAFALVSFCYFTTAGLFNPYAPLWFKELGLSTLAIGTITSLQAWTRVVPPYAWGWLGDHTGRRVDIMRWTSLGCVVSSLALFSVTGYWGAAVATLLLFGFNSALMPMHDAALGRLLATERGFDAGRYGRVRMWGSIGFIITVVTCGALLDATGVGLFPWLVVLFNGVMLLAVLRLPRLRTPVVQGEPTPPVLPMLRQPEVAWFFASAFFTVTGHGVLYAFFSLYLVSLGWGKATVGALWALAAVVEVLFFWRQGGWFHRLSLHRWLEIAAGVSVLRFALMAMIGWMPALVLVAQPLHAITFAAHHATCIAMVHRLFPDRLRGRGQALYTVLGYGLSGVVAGIGGGWLIDRWGYAAAFWAASGAAVLAWVCARQSARHATAAATG
jgi:PPP family 3-phenylpropionic acid transporter